MISLQCFLSKSEYAILSNTVRKRIRNLSQKLHSIKIDVITSSLGFPTGWESSSKIPQN